MREDESEMVRMGEENRRPDKDRDGEEERMR